jgi:large subunit ribosomal protein L10
VALNLNQKQDIVAEITEQVKTAQTIVVAEYRGVTVGAMTALRKKARENGVYLRVLKNTLAQRAVQGTSFESLADSMKGPLIYGISEDAVAPAKILADFAKTNDKIILQAGVYNGKFLDCKAVNQLAAIPSREELLGKLANVMQAPIAGFARALGAVAKQKEEANGTPVAEATATETVTTEAVTTEEVSTETAA